MIKPLVIGAPFGNWIQWPGCTPTLGTFTLQYRGGLAYRLWRCLLTLRPHPRMRAWTNRLGLPNPGIDYLRERDRCDKTTGCIVSISARRNEDWLSLFCKLKQSYIFPGPVELNVSCPNCGDKDESVYRVVFRDARDVLRDPDWQVIVKLPPVNYQPTLYAALDACVTRFHCCNTLPTPAGGMSGKPLQLLSLACVEMVRGLRPDAFIIGGGGVTGSDDVRRFRDAGANSVSFASALLNPFRWPALRRLAAC